MEEISKKTKLILANIDAENATSSDGTAQINSSFSSSSQLASCGPNAGVQ